MRQQCMQAAIVSCPITATASARRQQQQQQSDTQQFGGNEEGRADSDAARRGSQVSEPRGVARREDGVGAHCEGGVQAGEEGRKCR